MKVLAYLMVLLLVIGLGVALLFYDLSAIYATFLAGLFLAIGALGLVYPLFHRKKSLKGED